MPTPDFRLIDSTFARPDGLTVRGVVHTGEDGPLARWTYTQGERTMARSGTPTEADVKALWNALNDPFFTPFRRDDATALDPADGHVLALAFAAAEGGDLGHAALVVPYDAEAPVWAEWKARWRTLQETSTLDADEAPPSGPGVSGGPPPLGGDAG